MKKTFALTALACTSLVLTACRAFKGYWLGVLTHPDNIPNDSKIITYLGYYVYICNDFVGKILTDNTMLINVHFANKSLTGKLLG